MRLIDTQTLRLRSVTEPADYSYAILSHVWEDEEVTYQDFQDPERASKMKGFGKIARTCQLASERGLQYAWVDTCCIDKASSAELSEAINSMFRWYMNSAVCVVFLSDLARESLFEHHFPHCKWLTRGWTLQELVAPRRVEFYDATWGFRGRKPELNTLLSNVTGIDKAVLHDNQAMFEVPIARRMSWASMRQTTRIEDKAYCLLGIFDVNMPMIYGEGDKAFIRLQEEIAKGSSDLSLFAWVDPTPGLPDTETRAQRNYRGIFARSPREFAACGHLRPRIRDAVLDKEFTITNKGLRIETTLVSVPSVTQDYIWNLGFSERDDWPKEIMDGWVGVHLAKTANGYVRSNPQYLYRAGPGVARYRLDNSLVNISRILRTAECESIENRFRGSVCIEFSQASCSVAAVAPRQLWDPNRTLFLNQGQGINAYILLLVQLEHRSESIRLLVTCSTMTEAVCTIWPENNPLWNHLLHFMETAKEVSDYVAADYLKMQFLSNRASKPSSSATYSVKPHEGSVINLQAHLQAHVYEGQPCFKLMLALSQTTLDTIDEEGFRNINMC